MQVCVYPWQSEIQVEIFLLIFCFRKINNVSQDVRDRVRYSSKVHRNNNGHTKLLTVLPEEERLRRVEEIITNI